MFQSFAKAHVLEKGQEIEYIKAGTQWSYYRRHLLNSRIGNVCTHPCWLAADFKDGNSNASNVQSWFGSLNATSDVKLTALLSESDHILLLADIDWQYDITMDRMCGVIINNLNFISVMGTVRYKHRSIENLDCLSRSIWVFDFK